ncbi:glycosyltransferase family 4 protein [Palleronia sp.]|uniref:glycosyltransferase family 4 protein n=1 Tax=Palleronia sp. TaxID=1940284 RepID=UPI0035C87EA6
MKLLILSRYDRQGASSRLRQLQYIPYLKEAGFEVEVRPLFGSAYLDDLYAGRRNRPAILRSYRQRIDRLRQLSIYDVVWIEKEALPWLPADIERRLISKTPAIVTDYDDAVFHRYDQHQLSAVRRLLGNKIASVMHGSDTVLAGNAYLAEYAKRAGATWIELVPTVVDTDIYTVLSPQSRSSSVSLGWIGTPGTWRECMVPFLPPLKELIGEKEVKFIAVGAGQDALESCNFDIRPWFESTEISNIQEMDIGIMPLPDMPWMQGKCGYKLIQYMACGLPVVASPVGVNSEIVEHGVNGFLARTEREWTEALKALIGDPELRRRLGAEGRKKIESWYSLQVQGPRVAGILREAAERRSEQRTGKTCVE